MERGSSTTDVDDKKKMKGKVLEEPTMEPESDPLLVLRNFSGEAVRDPKRKKSTFWICLVLILPRLHRTQMMRMRSSLQR